MPAEMATFPRLSNSATVSDPEPDALSVPQTIPHAGSGSSKRGPASMGTSGGTSAVASGSSRTSAPVSEPTSGPESSSASIPASVAGVEEEHAQMSAHPHTNLPTRGYEARFVPANSGTTRLSVTQQTGQTQVRSSSPLTVGTHMNGEPPQASSPMHAQLGVPPHAGSMGTQVIVSKNAWALTQAWLAGQASQLGTESHDSIGTQRNE